jgi:hypothetical protein
MGLDYPKSWPLKCPECRDRVQVELPPETPEGATGTAPCRRGHVLVYGYDGVTVMLIEVATESAR